MKTLIAALMLALMANVAFAQQTQKDQPFHFQFNVAPSVNAGTPAPVGQVFPFDGPPAAIAPDLKNSPLYDVRADVTPMNSFGFGFRAVGWSASGSVSGTARGADDVRLWDAPLSAYLVSTEPIMIGQSNFSASAKQKLRRYDLSAIYGHQVGRGYLSAFGGVSFTQIERSEDQSFAQKYLLLSLLPNGASDPKSILEKYAYESNSAAKFSGVGPMIGAEGSVCPVGRIILQGRADVAWFQWGSGSAATGSWDWTKRGSLVPTSGGVTQPLQSDLFAPIQVDVPVNPPKNNHVWADELEGSIRIQLAKSIQAGIGYSLAKYYNLPVVQHWTIPAGYAPQFGHWSDAGDSYLTLKSLEIVLNFRF